MPPTLLVTGASGHLAQSVIVNLLDVHHVPAARIVAGTRSPDKLGALRSSGIAVRKLDFEDASTLTAGLAGVDRMLLISTDAVDRPGRRVAQHKAALEAARVGGVKHVIYTSMPNPADSLVTFAPDHLETERVLAASGLEWTILRMNWYMDNLLRSLPAAIAAGQWRTATGDGRVGYVAREDCARTAAAALVQSGAPNSRFDVTGPETLSSAQIAAVVREVTGKPLEVVQIGVEELRKGLAGSGLPGPVVDLIVSIDANTRAGKLDVASDTVKKLTGSPPISLRAFLTEHKSVLVGA